MRYNLMQRTIGSILLLAAMATAAEFKMTTAQVSCSAVAPIGLWRRITDKLTCDRAVKILLDAGQVATEENEYDYPLGCYKLNSNSKAYWNDGSNAISSTAACTSNSMPCLCQRATPVILEGVSIQLAVGDFDLGTGCPTCRVKLNGGAGEVANDYLWDAASAQVSKLGSHTTHNELLLHA